jgi:hypothetical protein
MPNADRNPAWLPRGGPEPAGSYNGRPFRRYKVVLQPGELAQCYQVRCAQCEELDPPLYGDPNIGRVQVEVQLGNEGWSLTADGWMCPLCVAERPRGVKLPRREKT